MTADVDLTRPQTANTDTRPFIGRFVRRQGNYGTIGAVGRVSTGAVEILDDSKRHLVETQGVTHAHLAPGDWVQFDVVRNSRPRAPEYKTIHLRRLPRYAVLPEASVAEYRVLLTKEGWRGEKRPGVWALRTSGDRVLVIELEAGNDGALRTPRKAACDVHWYGYRDELVVQLPAEGGAEYVFVCDLDAPSGSFDWSDEADHIARVIRSLSDANDPVVPEIITWLELHREEGTGRVFAAGVDHQAAEAALRSGELAERLRADRDLLKTYLDAALQDDAVREAVATWAREGLGAEAARLRAELELEIAEARGLSAAELRAEIEVARLEALAKVEVEAAELAETRRAEAEASRQDAEAALAARLQALDVEFAERRSTLEQDVETHREALEDIKAESEAATAQLEQVRSDEEAARGRLVTTTAQIDRLLTIADRLDPPANQLATAVAAPVGGIQHIFHERPLAAAAAKGQLIGRQVLLTDGGKEQMRLLAALLLAGELPVLIGGDAAGLLSVAEALLCPGRSASIEADPTMISIDDLWARPGSGVPTALACAAAAAASGGAALVIIRGIERSGARFWFPALAAALRSGALPRGLLVCCVAGDPEHEEVEALPRDLHLIEVEGALADSAYLAGPALLTPPGLELTALDPGPAPGDLSPANPLLATLGFKPPLHQAMRIARIFVEARALFDKGTARSVVERIARTMAERAGRRAP